jgi:hypothetical protein
VADGAIRTQDPTQLQQQPLWWSQQHDLLAIMAIAMQIGLAKLVFIVTVADGAIRTDKTFEN